MPLGLTLIGMSYESKKCSSLVPPRSKFYKIQWAWQGVKLTRLMSFFFRNFGYKFSWQNLIQKVQESGKCPASCQLGLKNGRRKEVNKKLGKGLLVITLSALLQAWAKLRRNFILLHPIVLCNEKHSCFSKLHSIMYLAK